MQWRNPPICNTITCLIVVNIAVHVALLAAVGDGGDGSDPDDDGLRVPVSRAHLRQGQGHDHHLLCEDAVRHQIDLVDLNDIDVNSYQHMFHM